MKRIFLAAIAAAMLTGPALADETMSTTTPDLALPEPDAPAAVLPQSTVSEEAPLLLPEPETDPIAPVHGCRGNDLSV